MKYKVVLIFVIIISFYFYSKSKYSFSLQLQKAVNPENHSTRVKFQYPLILAYTSFYEHKIFNAKTMKALKNCPYHCEISEDIG